MMENDALRQAFLNNLRKQMSCPESAEDKGKCTFANKVMYGSDWHMIKMVNNADSYLEMMNELFSEDGMSDYKEAFFSRNAIRFLGLERYIEKLERLPNRPFDEDHIEYLKSLL